MKYVLTGGAGHITKPAAEKILAAGHDVTIISRNADHVKELVAKGAKVAAGSVEDAAFLTTAFAGADAVYLMIPPNFNPGENWRAFQNKVADTFVAAIAKNSIKNVVVLSSVGAHMGEGSGPVDGLADLEKKLATLNEVNIKFLRPSYFMYNLFGMIPMIKGMNIMGGNFGGTGEKLLLAHTNDIADVLAEELLRLNFTGTSIRYIASDERDPAEIAVVLSNAIGKPGIPWVAFTDEQALGGMLQAGLPETIAIGYTDLGKALRTGAAQEDYWKQQPVLGKVKLEDFAKEFSAAFNTQS
ncbi:MAG: NAD(P)H-binding protein [Chitinophagaceae bacterium]|nr:NAD(P)H-binding protein [Chitinophagaceae bacterium]